MTRRKTGPRKPLRRKFRDRINDSDLWKCWYCGRCLAARTRTFDHLVPLSEGGTHDPDNLVPACGSCNRKKANLSVDQFREVFVRGLQHHGLKASDEFHGERRQRERMALSGPQRGVTPEQGQGDT